MKCENVATVQIIESVVSSMGILTIPTWPWVEFFHISDCFLYFMCHGGGESKSELCVWGGRNDHIRLIGVTQDFYIRCQ